MCGHTQMEWLVPITMVCPQNSSLPVLFEHYEVHRPYLICIFLGSNPSSMLVWPWPCRCDKAWNHRGRGAGIIVHRRILLFIILTANTTCLTRVGFPWGSRVSICLITIPPCRACILLWRESKGALNLVKGDWKGPDVNFHVDGSDSNCHQIYHRRYAIAYTVLVRRKPHQC